MLTTAWGILSIEMLAAQGPVGTRGGVEWMRGPCSCPGWGATWLLHAVPTGARCHQGQAQGPHPAPYPPLVPTGPHSVVNIHQERGRHITGFGRQHSLSAFAGCSALPLNLLNRIMKPLRKR